MEGPLYKIIVMLFFNVSRRKHLDSVGSRDRLVVIQQRASCSSFLISKGAVHTGAVCTGAVCTGTVCTGSVCTGAVCTGAVCTGTMCTGSVCRGAVCTEAMCFRIVGTGEHLHVYYLSLDHLPIKASTSYSMVSLQNEFGAPSN